MRDTRGVRASGLQGDTSAEIIEIIDDDTDAFGDRAPNATIVDTGGPRWVGPVAAMALVALIGYGVATSASTSSTPKVAPASSTSLAPTTTQPAPAPTTTIPPPPVPYYAVDPPREFTLESVEIWESTGGRVDMGEYQLWATSDATATSGKWFSVEGYAGGVQSLFAAEAYRVETDWGTVGISRTDSGQSVAQFVSNRTALMVRSYGFTDEELVLLAGEIRIERGDIEVSEIPLISDLRLLSKVYPWFALQGEPLEYVSYSDGNNPSRSVTIAVALRPPSEQGGSTLDRQTALRFFIDHATPFEVDGHVAVAGALIGQSEYAVATWIARDHIVTVSGAMTVPELITLARTTHEVSAAEWSGMQFQAARHSRDNNFGEYEQTEPVAVSFGTDANGDAWLVNVGIATYDDVQLVVWQWDGFGFDSEIDETATIRTVVSEDRTYVLADLPRALAVTAQLQVTAAGLEPVLVPFTDTDPSLDRTFAAYAFSQPGQYTAQIVGADGAVLASWPAG